MLRALRSVAAAAVPCVLFAGEASAAPPAACAPAASPPYKVVVHAPPPSVVVVEGEGSDRRLKLFGHHKKKERPEAGPPTYYMQVPAMVPAAAPCATPPAAAPCAAPPCATPPMACGRPIGFLGVPGENPTSIAAAGQDLRATIEHLKALRAQREAEIAAIDTALAPAGGTPARPVAKGVTVSNPGPPRNELADLNDKINYLAALIDALAEDVRKAEPNRRLPAFDELNSLRKSKP